MRFSIFKEQITPDWPIRLEGFRNRPLPYKGVYDQIYATALLLDDSKRKVLLVSLDVCMIDRFFAVGIKERISTEYGLSEENIIVHAIHTHASPIVFLYNSMKGTPDYDSIVRFRNLIEQKVMLCVGNCMSNLKEGSMEIGTGETYIGMSRRKRYPDRVWIGPNHGEEIDRTAYALTIKNNDEKVEVVLFSCPCHPVILYSDNMSISADFPGAARTEIEKRFPWATAMFMQGSGADINPAVLTANDEYRSTFYSDVILTGNVLANDIYNIIQKGMRKLDVSIESCAEKIILPLKGNPEREIKPEEVDILRGIIQGEIQAMVIKLSEDFRIITLDGEICNQLGLQMRELFQYGHTMVLGHGNGCLGYIPTAKILQEGGYESIRTRFVEPFAENMEEVLLGQLRTLIRHITVQCKEQ